MTVNALLSTTPNTNFNNLQSHLPSWSRGKVLASQANVQLPAQLGDLKKKILPTATLKNTGKWKKILENSVFFCGNNGMIFCSGVHDLRWSVLAKRRVEQQLQSTTDLL